MKAALLALLLLPSVSIGAESDCLASIMYAEAQGESVEGVVAVGQSAINRSKITHHSLCRLPGVSTQLIPERLKSGYTALAKSALASKSVVGKADSWERALIPHRAGAITRRIGKHTFYVMAGL